LADDFATFHTPLLPPLTKTLIPVANDKNLPFTSISDTEDACYYWAPAPKPVF